MLDPKFVKENLSEVTLAAKHKGFPFDPERFSELFEKRLSSIEKTENLRQKRNEGSDAVKNAGSKEQRAVLVEDMKKVNAALSEAESENKALEEELRTIMLRTPNVFSKDTPIGKDDTENVEVKRVGEPKFNSKNSTNHIDLSAQLGIVDFQRGTQIAGSRSYFLVGQGAMLERAVHSFAMDLLIERGFVPYSIPVLVKPSAMEGTGYLPGGEEQAYYVEKDDLWLVGTSEVSLASFRGDEILNAEDLPARLCAHSSCFRREAGAHGKDTKGLYRVHQFQKIEQVVLCYPDIEESNKLHDELLKNAEDIVQALELPYRVVSVCSGDLGLGQVKKHDIEVWMPGRDNYGETHSCSSFYDFQARRLKIRVKDRDGKTKPVFTLNNTAAATPRLLIPLLENHQEADGRVRIPQALRKYMGGKTHISKG
jgi:seryl-tRNA synthetase